MMVRLANSLLLIACIARRSSLTFLMEVKKHCLTFRNRITNISNSCCNLCVTDHVCLLRTIFSSVVRVKLLLWTIGLAFGISNYFNISVAVDMLFWKISPNFGIDFRFWMFQILKNRFFLPVRSTPFFLHLLKQNGAT